MQSKNNTPQKTVLISPLDWGLGHAARCIPIIKELQKNNAKVLIAGSGRSLNLLQTEFPELNFFKLRGYSPRLAGNRIQWAYLLFSTPLFIWYMVSEHVLLKKILRNTKIDLIISDNRFGVRNKHVHSVIITHQLFLKYPSGILGLGKIADYFNHLLLKKFDRVWIPDFSSENNLSGDLSHKSKLPSNAIFIGPISRFMEFLPEEPVSETIDILAVISGPEPQRSRFEQLIVNQLRDTNYQSIIIRGVTNNSDGPETKCNIRFYNHIRSSELRRLIKQAQLVLCRPGYTTIMDLTFTGSKALFVPTPGQTEQEYLGRLLYEKGVAMFVEQHKLDLKIHIPDAMKFSGFDKLEANSGSIGQLQRTLFENFGQ